MTKKDFLNIIKDYPDNCNIEIKDNRCFILSQFRYPSIININCTNNTIQIEIDK